MTIDRRDTGFGAEASTTGAANVPGVPALVENDQFHVVTASNDKLKLAYDSGAVTDVTLNAGCYDYDAMETELKTRIDAALSCTSTVTFDAVAETFSIDAGSGHTLALTHTGSTAADQLGFTADQGASQVLTSDSEAAGSGTITFDFSDSSNGDTVEYCILNNTTGEYVDTDGSTNGAFEKWATFAGWNNGGQNGRVTVTGLTDFTNYTFKVKARNEAGGETAYSADSAVMNTRPTIDWGRVSDSLSREITTGNTKVMLNQYADDDGEYTREIVVTGEYGDIQLKARLQNMASTASRWVWEWSEDGVTWAACTAGTGGDGLAGLSTSPTGEEHTFVWDSYTDCGNSEYDETVYVRCTPYDASPSGGDAGEPVTSHAFTVNNLPEQLTLVNGDGYTFDKDTTPVFQAIMQSIRGGSKLFFKLQVYESSGSLELSRSSAIAVAGWEHETATDTWAAVTAAGVDPAYVNGTNRIRYTIQPADALAQDNDDPYSVVIYAGEVRDRD